MTQPNVLPGLTTGGFNKAPFPADVANRIFSLLVDNAPFARSVTPAPTIRSAMAFTRAAPSGFAWLKEMQEFPLLNLGDNALVVEVRKLGGLLDISNEAWNDGQNITGQIGTALQDSLSIELDQGLLYGEGEDANEPDGIVAAAPAVDGDDLLAGVSAAIGEIADAGGLPNRIAIGGAALAAASTTRTNTGELMFGTGGFAAAVGLQPVVVPGMAHVLVYDSTRIFFILNGQNSQVDYSEDYRFAHDARTLRLKVRASIGVPVPAKAMRKVNVADAGRTALSVEATPVG